MAMQHSLPRWLFVQAQLARRKQESIGYEVHNHSDLTFSAQVFVSSEANSSAVGGE